MIRVLAAVEATEHFTEVTGSTNKATFFQARHERQPHPTISSYQHNSLLCDSVRGRGRTRAARVWEYFNSNGENWVAYSAQNTLALDEAFETQAPGAEVTETLEGSARPAKCRVDF